ncbi:putative oxidoreductase [Gordonia spumicola]|uniref:Putative oxidoreductase n=1 Tax=Gordonia spumicola TaxID=589161 RepID=A0A7I9V6J4_9ACTN|nr:ferredoxin reductase [Gordonia spumicola]GEE00844.1 putative oxidoreductase [Gordonia spumicola]
MANRIATLVGSLVEATATPYPVDRYLEFIDPMLTWRDTRAKVVEVRRQTDRSTTVTLRPTRQWKGHTAGQYVEVGVVINGTRHRRFYSPANAEGSRGDIELTIAVHENGLVSNHLRENATVGDVVSLETAGGVFALPAQRPAEIVLVSGGSGITPVLSMLRTLVAEGHRGPITFVHYARTPDDVPYSVELDAIDRTIDGVDVRMHYTRTENPEHFVAEHISDVAERNGAQVYMCGPGALMSAVREYADTAGIADRVHSEAFTIEAPAAPTADQIGGDVVFAKSNVTADNDGRTILEQAEGAGLTPEFGCRMGICFGCTKIRKSGTTRNVLTGDLDSEPDKHIQICITAPCGDVEIDV